MVLEKREVHTLLSIPLFLQTFVGTRCPPDFNPFKKVLYNCYRTIIFIVLVLLTIMVFLYVYECITSKRFEPWPLFILMTLSNSIYKFISISRREWIQTILAMGFSERWTKPRNYSEVELMEDFNKKSRGVQVSYLGMFLFSSMLKTVVPVFMNVEENSNLPVETYLPYDIQVPLYYWLTICYQGVGAMYMGALVISSDMLLSSILSQICLQFKLIKNRLAQYKELSIEKYGKLSNSEVKILERKLVREFISDHDFIYKFSEEVKKGFYGWIVSIFIVGTPNLCINAYVMVFSETMMESVSALFTGLVCATEITWLCWCGNEVTNHSADLRSALYDTDWMHFSNSVKKDFLIVSLRASKPVRVTFGPLLTLNNDAMIAILKTSYSALNILKNT